MLSVTPCVGVWIETDGKDGADGESMSHPAWVCGLKPLTFDDVIDACGHTLRGCVD